MQTSNRHWKASDSIMEKILIVEDDEGISSFVNAELIHEGYQTVLAADGNQALKKFEEENPSLILLDIMIPGINGIEVLQQIRKTSSVPVIMVTALGQTEDKVSALNGGADDYISKPFEIEELLARMAAVLRRTAGSKENPAVLQNGPIKLDIQNMKASVAGQEIIFSKTEYMMLKCFLENIDEVLTRQQIIEYIWGKGHFIDDNTVDVYVGYLRTKFAAAGAGGVAVDNSLIKTVRGLGYKMEGR